MDSNYVTYSKREIAETQLRLAIQLYISEQDYLSSTTLAGASEEILGKMVRLRNEKSSLDLGYENFSRVHRNIWEEEAPKLKYYADIKNAPRNQLKHLDGCKDVTIDQERVSEQMIVRALKNYHLLYGVQFELSQGFNEKRLNSLKNNDRNS
jgi:hypothetical protein